MKKIISTITCVCVLATNCLFVHAVETNFWQERQKAALLASPSQRSLHAVSVTKPTDDSSLTPLERLLRRLPYRLGTVRGIKKPVTGASEKIVLLVQDIHMNKEAQANISAVMKTLGQGPLLNYVVLEGTDGPIDVKSARSAFDADVMARVADFLLETNRISGPVHAALTMPSMPPAFFGGEDPRLYQQNLDAYLGAATHAAGYRQRLLAQESRMLKKNRDRLNPELVAFDALARRYQEKQIELGAYLEQLSAYGNLPAPLRVFLDAVRMERSFDLARVEVERGAFLEKLTRSLSKEEATALVDAGLSYRMATFSPSDFYRQLSDLARQKRVPLKDFPALDNYVRYVLAADSIDTAALFGAIRSQEEKIYSALARTGEEKRLIKQLQLNRATRRLTDFALTPSEWADYVSLKKTVPVPLFERLSHFEDFYLKANERNAAMADRVVRASGPGASVGVLVTGGFHTDGIVAILNRAGYTTVSFVPKITKITGGGESAYLSVFAQEKTPLEKLVMGEKLFMAANPYGGKPLVPVLGDVNKEAREKLRGALNKTVTIDRSYDSAGGDVTAEFKLERLEDAPQEAPKFVSMESAAHRPGRNNFKRTGQISFGLGVVLALLGSMTLAAGIYFSKFSTPVTTAAVPQITWTVEQESDRLSVEAQLNALNESAARYDLAGVQKRLAAGYRAEKTAKVQEEINKLKNLRANLETAQSFKEIQKDLNEKIKQLENDRNFDAKMKRLMAENPEKYRATRITGASGSKVSYYESIGPDKWKLMGPHNVEELEIKIFAAKNDLSAATANFKKAEKTLAAGGLTPAQISEELEKSESALADLADGKEDAEIDDRAKSASNEPLEKMKTSAAGLLQRSQELNAKKVQFTGAPSTTAEIQAPQLGPIQADEIFNDTAENKNALIEKYRGQKIEALKKDISELEVLRANSDAAKDLSARQRELAEKLQSIEELKADPYAGIRRRVAADPEKYRTVLVNGAPSYYELDPSNPKAGTLLRPESPEELKLRAGVIAAEIDDVRQKFTSAENVLSRKNLSSSEIEEKLSAAKSALSAIEAGGVDGQIEAEAKKEQSETAKKIAQTKEKTLASLKKAVLDAATESETPAGAPGEKTRYVTAREYWLPISLGVIGFAVFSFRILRNLVRRPAAIVKAPEEPAPILLTVADKDPGPVKTVAEKTVKKTVESKAGNVKSEDLVRTLLTGKKNGPNGKNGHKADKTQLVVGKVGLNGGKIQTISYFNTETNETEKIDYTYTGSELTGSVRTITDQDGSTRLEEETVYKTGERTVRQSFYDTEGRTDLVMTVKDTQRDDEGRPLKTATFKNGSKYFFQISDLNYEASPGIFVETLYQRQRLESNDPLINEKNIVEKWEYRQGSPATSDIRLPKKSTLISRHDGTVVTTTRLYHIDFVEISSEEIPDSLRKSVEFVVTPLAAPFSEPVVDPAVAPIAEEIIPLIPAPQTTETPEVEISVEKSKPTVLQPGAPKTKNSLLAWFLILTSSLGLARLLAKDEDAPALPTTSMVWTNEDRRAKEKLTGQLNEMGIDAIAHGTKENLQALAAFRRNEKIKRLQSEVDRLELLRTNYRIMIAARDREREVSAALSGIDVNEDLDELMQRLMESDPHKNDAAKRKYHVVTMTSGASAPKHTYFERNPNSPSGWTAIGPEKLEEHKAIAAGLSQEREKALELFRNAENVVRGNTLEPEEIEDAYKKAASSIFALKAGETDEEVQAQVTQDVSQAREQIAGAQAKVEEKLKGLIEKEHAAKSPVTESAPASENYFSFQFLWGYVLVTLGFIWGAAIIVTQRFARPPPAAKVWQTEATREETALHEGRITWRQWLNNHNTSGLPWALLFGLRLFISSVKTMLINRKLGLRSAISIHWLYNFSYDWLFAPLEMLAKFPLRLINKVPGMQLVPFRPVEKLVNARWMVRATTEVEQRKTLGAGSARRNEIKGSMKVEEGVALIYLLLREYGFIADENMEFYFDGERISAEEARSRRYKDVLIIPYGISSDYGDNRTPGDHRQFITNYDRELQRPKRNKNRTRYYKKLIRDLIDQLALGLINVEQFRQKMIFKGEVKRRFGEQFGKLTISVMMEYLDDYWRGRFMPHWMPPSKKPRISDKKLRDMLLSGQIDMNTMRDMEKDQLNREAGGKFGRYVFDLRLEPLLLIDYERYAIFSPDGKWRGNFDINNRGIFRKRSVPLLDPDTNIVQFPPANQFRLTWPGFGIFESKFEKDEHIPFYLGQVLKGFDIDVAGWSKICDFFLKQLDERPDKEVPVGPLFDPENPHRYSGWGTRDYIGEKQVESNAGDGIAGYLGGHNDGDDEMPHFDPVLDTVEEEDPGMRISGSVEDGKIVYDKLVLHRIPEEGEARHDEEDAEEGELSVFVLPLAFLPLLFEVAVEVGLNLLWGLFAASALVYMRKPINRFVKRSQGLNRVLGSVKSLGVAAADRASHVPYSRVNIMRMVALSFGLLLFFGFTPIAAAAGFDTYSISNFVSYKQQKVILSLWHVLSISAVSGYFLGVVYKETQDEGRSYDRKFTSTIAIISPIMGFIVFVLINAPLVVATPLGIAAIAGLLNIRTIVRVPMDLMYMAAAMAGGIAAGVSFPFGTVMFTAFIIFLLLFLHNIEYGLQNRVHLNISFYFAGTEKELAAFEKVVMERIADGGEKGVYRTGVEQTKEKNRLFVNYRLRLVNPDDHLSALSAIIGFVIPGEVGAPNRNPIEEASFRARPPARGRIIDFLRKIYGVQDLQPTTAMPEGWNSMVEKIEQANADREDLQKASTRPKYWLIYYLWRGIAKWTVILAVIASNVVPMTYKYWGTFTSQSPPARRIGWEARGTVLGQEDPQVTLHAGKLKHVFVKTGQTVKPGQVLMVVQKDGKSEALRNAKRQELEADLQIAHRELELKRAELELRIKAGDVDQQRLQMDLLRTEFSLRDLQLRWIANRAELAAKLAAARELALTVQQEISFLEMEPIWELTRITDSQGYYEDISQQYAWSSRASFGIENRNTRGASAMSRSGRNSSIQNGSNASLETGRGNSTTSGTTNRATTGTRADNSLRMDNIFESRSNGLTLSRTGTANQTRTGTIDRNMTGTSLDVRSTDSSSERRGVSVDVRNGVSSQEGSENSFSRSFGTSQNYSNGFRYAETYRQGRRWDHAETMEVFPKLEHRVEAMRKAGDARLALVEARAGAEMLQLIDLESDIVRLMRELDTQSLNMETFKKEAAVSKAKTLKWDDHKDAITKKISSAITAIEIVEDPYHVLVSGVNGQAQVIKGVEGTNVVREERLAIVRESVTKVDVKLVPPLEGLPFRGMKVKIIDPGNGNEFAGTVVRVNEFEETLPRDVQRTSTGVDILFTPNQANPASVSVVVEIDPGQITETKKLRAGETVDAIIEPQTDPKAGEETWPKPVFDFAALAAQQPKPLVPQPLRLKGLAQTADSGLFDRNGNEIDTKNGKLREFSGLTFNYDTKTFFTIDDEAQVVIEFDMNKKFIRTIDVSGLADPKRGPLDLEAIKWITGSHFALLNEGDKNRSAELIIADLSGYMPQRWDARIYELPVRNAESVAFDSDGHLYFATSNVIYKTAKLKENGAGQVFPVTVIEKWDVVNYGWEPIGDIEFVKKNDETPHFYVTTKGDKDKKIAPAVRELAFKSKGKVDLIDSRDIVIRDKFEGLTRFKTSDGADGLAGIAEGPKDGKSKTPYVIGFTMPPGLLGIWLPLVRVFPRVGALVGSLTEATAPALLYIFAPHFGSLLDAEFLPFIWMGVIGLLKSISGFVGIDRYGRFYRGSARDDGADFMFSNMVAWTGLMVFVVQPPTVMGALLVAWILHVVVDVWIVHQKTSFVRALSRIEPEEVIVVPISDEHRQRDMDRLHELKQVISNNESLAHLKDQVLVVYLGNERSMPISIRNVAREYQIVRGSQHDLDAIFKEAQSQILDHESKMYATVSDLADPNGTFGRFAVLDPQHGIFSMSDGLARRHRAIVQFLGVWTLQDSTTSVLNLMMGAKIAESHA